MRKASLAKEERDYIVKYIEDKLKSIQVAIDKIKDGSDMEKGYLLEKVNALLTFVKKEL
jgi:hypothetical protein